MIRGHIVLAILLAGPLAAVTPAALWLVKDGQPSAVVVLPESPTPCESYAARELVDAVQRMTGARLRVVPETAYTAKDGPCVSLGKTRLGRAAATQAELDAMGDGYRIVTRDGTGFIVGGGKRGTLYGVYDFLERQGVRWYSPDYTVVPKCADVSLPAGKVEFKPKMWYRDQWWNNGATPEWLVRMRVNASNGQDHTLPESMGGQISSMNNCHSFATVVPPALLEEHPDWFALKPNGKRSPSELCLTNPELRDFAVRRVLADLRAHPGQVDNYWVSQNDGGEDGCFCPACTAERERHGGKDRWSANTVAFVSYVAERTKAEFPKVLIKTLAYSYTVQPPADLTASDHMLIEICGNFDGADGAQAKLVTAWSKVARNVSVYTYGGSNFGYWWPYPNAYEVGAQPRWAAASGVSAFYVQGTALGHGSGLVDLKAYVSARMAWDPSRDVRKEIREFCRGFYGPGGRYVEEYLNWYPRYIASHCFPMEGGWGDPERWRKWVKKDAMVHCDGLFLKTVAACKGDPVHLRHVRRAFLEVLWGRVMIDLKPGTDFRAERLELAPGADEALVRDRIRLFNEIMKEAGYDKWSEVEGYAGGGR